VLPSESHSALGGMVSGSLEISECSLALCEHDGGSHYLDAVVNVGGKAVLEHDYALDHACSGGRERHLELIISLSFSSHLIHLILNRTQQ